MEAARDTLAGATKGSAMAALLPAYLRFLVDESGRLPRLGNRARLEALGREVIGGRSDHPASMGAELGRLLEAWGLPTTLDGLPFEAERIGDLVDETLELWGDPEILGWLPRGELTRFYRGAMSGAPLGGRRLK